MPNALTFRPAHVNGDWRAEDALPLPAVVVDSLRWSGGVVPAVDRAVLDLLIHEQAEIQRGDDFGAEQYGLRLDGEVLVVTAPPAEALTGAEAEVQRVEPQTIAGEQRWLLDLGWTFYEQERVVDVEGCCAEFEQCHPRDPEEALGEWIDSLVSHLIENGYAKPDVEAVRTAMRKRHGWVDTSDTHPGPPLVILVDGPDEVCPVCGSDDLQMWAEDGESPRADYYACEACKASGDVVQPEGWSNADLHANAEPFPEGPLCRFLNLHVDGVQRMLTNVEEDSPEEVCTNAERIALDQAFALKRANPDAVVTLVVDWDLAG